MAIIKCPECGAEISDKATSCPKCGNPMSENERMVSPSPQFHVTPTQQPTSTHNETVVVVEKESKSNGCAVAGFVMAILGLLLGWIPIVGWAIWFIGFILCVIGLFKSPRGMAIIGLIITFIDFITQVSQAQLSQVLGRFALEVVGYRGNNGTNRKISFRSFRSYKDLTTEQTEKIPFHSFRSLNTYNL